MKTITFENQFTHERVECPDVRDVRVVEGIEYLSVRRPGTSRTFLIRRDALKRVNETPDHRQK